MTLLKSSFLLQMKIFHHQSTLTSSRLSFLIPTSTVPYSDPLGHLSQSFLPPGGLDSVARGSGKGTHEGGLCGRVLSTGALKFLWTGRRPWKGAVSIFCGDSHGALPTVWIWGENAGACMGCTVKGYGGTYPFPGTCAKAPRESKRMKMGMGS